MKTRKGEVNLEVSVKLGGTAQLKSTLESMTPIQDILSCMMGNANMS
mgnify:CR=1 FL=1